MEYQQMILLELFNKPYKYNINEISSEGLRANFTDEEGHYYEVTFTQFDEHTYEVTFYGRESGGEYTIHLMSNTKTKPVRVFSTVAELMQKFADTYQVETYIFTAGEHESSRVSLYKRGLPALARRLMLNFKVIEPYEMYDIIKSRMNLSDADIEEMKMHEDPIDWYAFCLYHPALSIGDVGMKVLLALGYDS